MNQEELIQRIKIMEEQGAAQGLQPEQIRADIQNYIDSLPVSKEQKQGFVQSTVKDIARPFLRFSGAASRAAAGTIGLGASAVGRPDIAEKISEVSKQPIDYGYFGQHTPMGANLNTLEGLTKENIRAASDVIGTTAEAASYAFAPLKTAGGFWGTIKAASPIATTFGGGKGLQKFSETGEISKGVTSAIANAAGVTAGLALTSGGAQLISNWGARMLQSEAFKASASIARDFADQVFNALPEVMSQPMNALRNSATRNPSLKRTIAALEDNFQKIWKDSADTAIDSLNPNVADPDLALRAFQRSLSDEMGSNFRLNNELWDSAKASETLIPNWESTASKIDNVVSGMQKRLYDAYQKGNSSVAEKLSTPYAWLENVKARLNTGQGLTLKQIMDEWQGLMSQVPGLDNESKTAIRDVASSLYSHARDFLQKQDPETLKLWDRAYQQWFKSIDIYDSNVLNKLKTVGEIDTFVDKMITNKLSRPEMNAISNAIQKEEAGSLRELFINSVLRKVKSEKTTADGAKIIDDFLNNWDSILKPEQAKNLDDLSAFLKGNLDDFVQGMRQLQGVTPENVGRIQQSQTATKIVQAIDSGDIGKISSEFENLLREAPEEVSKAIDLFTDRQKQEVGSSIVSRILDPEIPMGSVNPDGTYKVDEQFAKSIVDTWNKIQSLETGASKGVLNKIFEKHQLDNLEQAARYAQQAIDTGLDEIPAEGFMRLVKAGIAGFYFQRGWYPGFISNITKAISPKTSEITPQQYYQAVDELIDLGLLNKNRLMRFADVIELLTQVRGVPQAGVEVLTD